MNERSIADFLNNEVKEYSISVIKERAIPHIIDGLKPSQRKIVYTADRVAKSYMKTSGLVGQVMCTGGYSKGDGSLGPAIINLAQEFPGTNNLPLLSGQGSFGSRFLPNGAASPRYTKTKISTNFEKFFIDKEILEYADQDGEVFEPKYFLPIIPTILANPTSGIAVGFACEFHPYHVDDIIENINNVLNNKPQKEMVPYYNGFKGTVTKNLDDKWEMRGIVTVRGMKAVISEIPVGIARENYISTLDKLEDSDYISSYTDECSKEGFRFVVTLTDKGKNLWSNIPEFFKKFKLSKILNENLNAITENNTLKEFSNANDIIEYFVKYRLSTLKTRKEFMVSKHHNIISFLDEKLRFLEQVTGISSTKAKIEKRIELNFKSKSDFVNVLNKSGYSEKHIDRLINIPAYKFTKEEIDKTVNEIKENQKTKKYYENVSVKKLYESDLNSL